MNVKPSPRKSIQLLLGPPDLGSITSIRRIPCVFVSVRLSEQTLFSLPLPALGYTARKEGDILGFFSSLCASLRKYDCVDIACMCVCA
jgi:hypothetical protein